jgi:Ca2+-binding EF-hand superfamily protein
MAERVPLTEDQVEQLKADFESLESEWDQDKASRIFAILDKDGNGTISFTELVTSVSQVHGEERGEQIAKDFLGQVDSNRDGVIQISEFLEWCRGRSGSVE